MFVVLLRRLPCDIKIIRVIKQYRKEGGEIGTTTFCIQQNIVLQALHWLKQYNIEYRDITIQESNLDWIKDGQEQNLPPSDIEIEAEETDLQPSFQDHGPSTSQLIPKTVDIQETNQEDQEETVFGMLPGTAPHLPKQKDSFITESLQEATKQGNDQNKKSTINFPYINPSPLSEYDTKTGLSLKLFLGFFQVAEEISINSEKPKFPFLTGLKI
jgi:hypothetical protein